jgi:hypothetical protein
MPWVLWVNDCLVVGTKEAVAIAKKQLASKFNRNEIGNMDEIKLTQPVMLQSFVDEFPMCLEGCASYTPATPGEHLVKGDDGSDWGDASSLQNGRHQAHAHDALDPARDPECSPIIVQSHVRCNTCALQGYAASHELLCHNCGMWNGIEAKLQVGC